MTRPQPIHHFRCARCDRPIRSHTIIRECYGCVDKAVRTYHLGPIEGEVSGT